MSGRKVAVNEWTCSIHDYPDHCDECGTWHCSECESSEWVKVGERDASVFEAMLIDGSRAPVFAPSLVARAIIDDRK